MLKTRIIPILLLQQNFLVKSVNFSRYQAIGNPFEEVKRFSQWQVDELIYLNIDKDNSLDNIDIGNPDRNISNFLSKYDLIKEINKYCFMPLSWGGNIKTINDVENILKNGADKVSINSEAFKNPELIIESARRFGAQAIIVSIDVKKKNNKYYVYIGGGKINTNVELEDYLKHINLLNIGEILIQNIDRDGVQKGYDLDLLELMLSKSKKPFIACSGVGEYSHLLEAAKMGVRALAAANIWHFKELVDKNIKKMMIEANIDIRL
jgi:imidazole glycerol-phosphate synthase subunit HisF